MEESVYFAMGNSAAQVWQEVYRTFARHSRTYLSHLFNCVWGVYFSSSLFG